MKCALRDPEHLHRRLAGGPGRAPPRKAGDTGVSDSPSAPLCLGFPSLRQVCEPEGNWGADEYRHLRTRPKVSGSQDPGTRGEKRGAQPLAGGGGGGETSLHIQRARLSFLGKEAWGHGRTRTWCIQAALRTTGDPCDPNTPSGSKPALLASLSAHESETVPAQGQCPACETFATRDNSRHGSGEPVQAFHPESLE